ncbi:uncharacterized protein LOC109533710 isoform X2 [Dendroctonus ponderosae]|uniref:uncharacterized protein LOC109533710 isoform X2 n=1 Tax=Dendroctonus ponderosae TaxID=77166 RepID=UPI0020362368|nr:uncharacterized protein LOC109533710 isoform X2 [Dendroctonus ponderosae]
MRLLRALERELESFCEVKVNVLETYFEVKNVHLKISLTVMQDKVVKLCLPKLIQDGLLKIRYLYQHERTLKLKLKIGLGTRRKDWKRKKLLYRFQIEEHSKNKFSLIPYVNVF